MLRGHRSRSYSRSLHRYRAIICRAALGFRQGLSWQAMAGSRDRAMANHQPAQLRHIALLVINGFMSSTHKSIISERPRAAMNWAALSAALPLFTPLAIPTCCWRALRHRSPPLNCASSSATPPRRLPVSCPWIPPHSGFPLPAPRFPHRFRPAARSNLPMSNSPSRRRALHRLSTPSANRSFKNPNAPNAPLISPSAVPATKASSFTMAISTGCRCSSPLCRRVAPRQNLPAGDAGPKAEATGYTWLFVQSLSPPPVTSIRRGFLLLSHVQTTAGAVLS